MDRLTGLRSFALIAGSLLLALRLLHVGVPVVFPATRQAPVAVTRLDDVRRLAGFAPIVPAYRPALLGEQPSRMTVTFSPRRTFAITWQAGEHYLSVTQRHGGPAPEHPPIARPLGEIANSLWWMDGSRSHVILPRGEFWMHLETSLPPSELRRFVDTLTEY